MFIELKVIIKRVNYMAKNVFVVHLFKCLRSACFRTHRRTPFACFPARSILVQHRRCYIPLSGSRNLVCASERALVHLH